MKDEKKKNVLTSSAEANIGSSRLNNKMKRKNNTINN